MSVPPIKDKSGKLLDFGVVRHTLSWDPYKEPTAPSWLTLPTPDANSSYAITGYGSGKPGIVFTFTGSTAPAIRTPAITMNDNVRAVMLTAKGVYGYPGSLQFRLAPVSAGSPPNKQGVAAVIAGADASTAFFTRNSATNITTTYAPARNSIVGSANISHLWVREANAAYLLEGESVVAVADLSTEFIVPTIMTPTLAVAAVAGRQVSLQGFELDIWYD